MERHQPLRQGAKDEPSLQASKWLQVQMLINASEMQHLFTTLGEFQIFFAGAIRPIGEESISKEDFLQAYGRYIALLQSGVVPEEKEFRAYFSSVLTRCKSHLFQVPTGNDRNLIRVSKPCIQLQLCRIAYSESDGKFRAMVFGQESFLWGLQFSYPQLYQDPLTKEIFSVKENFLNTSLFRQLQRWSRHHTIPTPFQVNSKITNTPMRIGKACFPWIASHPQLIQKNISVKCPAAVN